MLGSWTPLVAQALAQDRGTGGGLGLFLPLILMVAVFYFLLIRPQQRRARAQRELVQSLAKGDEVVTIGGLYGTIRELDDESVSLEVSPGVEMRFLRTAIARKLTYGEEDVGGSFDEGEAGGQP